MKSTDARTPALRGQDDLLFPGEGGPSSRRDFLKLSGFGLAAGLLTGCSRGPQRVLHPAAVASPGMVPGRSYWIASTCHGCSAACGVLAKCRDGRPIKLEGNPEHGLSRGGLCAVGQADVLGVYDAKRASAPTLDGAVVDWPAATRKLRSVLDAARSSGGRIRLVTNTIHSPSTRAWIRRFLDAYPGAEHVAYDPLSASAILRAHEETHGLRALPAYRFDRARVIAAFDADFLGTWISPVQFAADYVAGRRPEEGGASMSRHHHFEGRVSVTGGRADVRTRMAPHELRVALAALLEALESSLGAPRRSTGALEKCRIRERIEAAAADLAAARGRALVVCGVNDTVAQVLVNHANHLLRSYGATLSLARPSLQRGGDDRALERLGRELAGGKVDVLLVSGANPAYDLPPAFAARIGSAGTLVVHSAGLDETFAAAKIGLPAAHGLEAWDDGEPQAGHFTLTQPTLPALRQARTLRHVLADLLGDPRADGELLRDHWRNDPALPRAASGFEAAFDRALHDGYIERVDAQEPEEPAFVAASPPAVRPQPAPEGPTLVLYPEVKMLAGDHAHNPWLQELPDPVTKVTWDNCACLSPARAEALGVRTGDVVALTVNPDEPSLELPVLVQPGQHDDVVAVALGYGRAGTDRFQGVGPDWLEGTPTVRAGETIGVAAAGLQVLRDGDLRTDVRTVSLRRTGRAHTLATTQDHDRLEVPAHLAPRHGEVRHALQTVSLAAFEHDPEHALHREHLPQGVDLWPDDHPKTGHHWGMTVDLSACTGCSACVIACQAENNVPVVGRDEVHRHREMHWMRIDRYIAGDGDELTLGHQPMMCQQCDNAPCEAVCPVLATVHSSEGLNQQVYNRCVGTRYCANTCPYKVRRFNWFNYQREDELSNHALNPDVTVRSRGVMEKCSFCAQRIQEAKSEAARTGRPLRDGDIRSACEQSCPTQAIVFGDMNDPESRVSRLMARQRAYGVLTELNVKPSVRYLARVRNTPPKEADHG